MATVLLAGCGGGSDKSSTAATSTPAPTAATPTTASTPRSGIAARLLADNELEGFTGSRPTVFHTVGRWVTFKEIPSNEVASETKRLARMGFVVAASEDLNASSGGGVSLVAQFKTPGGARSELANEIKLFEAQASGPKRFPVTGIPGAVGLTAGGTGGFNVAFTSGDYYYLVGAFIHGPRAESKAAVAAAAKRLYQRVHG